MQYPPPAVLPRPDSMPSLPDTLQSLPLAEFGLITPAEELSNQHLCQTVSHLRTGTPFFSQTCVWPTASKEYPLLKPSASPSR